LWEKLQSEGYKMAFASVRRAVYRQYMPISVVPKNMARQQLYRPRKAAWCFVLDPLELVKSDYRFLLACLQNSTDLLQLYALAQGFQHLIIQSRCLGLFEHWITQATASIFPEIQRFARGLLQDEDAVRAALTYTWSNGPVEGQVLRLKLNRRKMYGRGNLDMLKRRIICAVK
jgi:transposase